MVLLWIQRVLLEIFPSISLQHFILGGVNYLGSGEAIEGDLVAISSHGLGLKLDEIGIFFVPCPNFTFFLSVSEEFEDAYSVKVGIQLQEIFLISYEIF